MAEVFRGLDVRGVEWVVNTRGDGLALTIWDRGNEGLCWTIDRETAMDLVDQLESWRAGWFTEEAADRG